ncbi:MAG: sigma-70 family RNA polymerase sigma factor [Chloroflexi bacterium]|nr:sigma-70 family RNA polymerase sigma factor [Chloroflexota bacterium]
MPAAHDEFGAWVEPHLPALARLAARLAPDGERDDVVQAALERAWRKRSSFDPARGTPLTWLLAITADQARRARRRDRPRAIFASSPPARSIDDRLDLEAAVARLPERQHLAVDCFYFVGLSVAETAAVMGCAEGTVKSTLSDARARLGRFLEGGSDAGRR